MSNSKQILAMLKCRASGDDELFYSIALQVAASEARQGRKTTATQIREAVQAARSGDTHAQGVAIPFGTPKGDLADLVELRKPRFKLAQVVLSEEIRGRLEELTREQLRRDWLREHGKVPNKRVLFVGPPGSGKTMTAGALAHELKIPHYVIRLESLITRYMGETAGKVRMVFDEIARRRGVYLFDEFDAVGGNRGAANDVAEMRRVLNTFLQLIEEENATDSLVVCATNHPSLLDRALLRRFDLVLEFTLPTAEQVRSLIISNIRPLKHPDIAWKKVCQAAEDLSQSEICRGVEDAVKAAILDERNSVTTEDLSHRLNQRTSMRDAFRLRSP